MAATYNPPEQPLDADLSTIAGLAPTNNDVLQRKSGAWANRTPAQVKTDLALAKGDVGLGNVDNTTDAGKPVSTATQTALDAKATTTVLTTHTASTSNPHSVTKAQVGLSALTNDAQIPLAQKGAANGVASLDGDGLVPTAQLPTVGSSRGRIVAESTAAASETLDLDGDAAVWATYVLDEDATVLDFDNATAGAVAQLRLIQPGGKLFSISDGTDEASVDIDTTADTMARVQILFLAADELQVDVLGSAPYVPPSAPVNTVAPAITGDAVTGETLTCDDGEWDGSPAPTLARQWKRAVANISGATASTYVLQVADEGLAIKCAVTATNASGSASANSNTVTPAPAATYNSIVLSDNPVLFLKLNEPSGAVATDSGSLGSNGTYVTGGGLTYSQTGIGDGETSVLFSAGNSGVTVPANAALRPANVTVEIWVYATSAPNNAVALASNLFTAVEGFMLGFGFLTGVGSIPQFGSYSSGWHSAADAGNVTTNAWHHLVGTYDGTNLKFYVDGALVATTAWAGPLAYDAATVQIGRDFSGANTATWRLAKAAIYNTALSAARVLAHFNAA